MEERSFVPFILALLGTSNVELRLQCALEVAEISLASCDLFPDAYGKRADCFFL